MTSNLLTDARDVDAQFALIVAQIDLAVTARVDPFSEPDYEPIEDDDEQSVEDEDPVIDWP